MYLDYTGVVVFICISLALYLGYHFYKKIHCRYLLNNSENRMEFLGSVEQGAKHIKNRTIGKIVFILSGVPLLIYPFVLAASLMGLAGYVNVIGFVEVIAYLFYILTIIYPIVYIMCGWSYLRKGAQRLAFIPLIHILICVIIFNLLA